MPPGRGRDKARSGLALAPAVATLVLVCTAAASDATQQEKVVVRVPSKPTANSGIDVSFRPGGQLPSGGYYYGVIVLGPYRGYTAGSPPPCSVSSDMRRTDYGYPKSTAPVRLALAPAKSITGRWCRGGRYAGAIYAVPHPPPCEAKYPCLAEPYEASPCWEVATGHRVCGVVARPKQYEYLDGLPRPLAKGARIVGRFSVRFR